MLIRRCGRSVTFVSYFWINGYKFLLCFFIWLGCDVIVVQWIWCNKAGFHRPRPTQTSTRLIILFQLNVTSNIFHQRQVKLAICFKFFNLVTKFGNKNKMSNAIEIMNTHPLKTAPFNPRYVCNLSVRLFSCHNHLIVVTIDCVCLSKTNSMINRSKAALGVLLLPFMRHRDYNFRLDK